LVTFGVVVTFDYVYTFTFDWLVDLLPRFVRCWLLRLRLPVVTFTVVVVRFVVTFHVYVALVGWLVYVWLLFAVGLRLRWLRYALLLFLLLITFTHFAFVCCYVYVTVVTFTLRLPVSYVAVTFTVYVVWADFVCFTVEHFVTFTLRLFCWLLFWFYVHVYVYAHHTFTLLFYILVVVWLLLILVTLRCYTFALLFGCYVTLFVAVRCLRGCVAVVVGFVIPGC